MRVGARALMPERKGVSSWLVVGEVLLVPCLTPARKFGFSLQWGF